MNRKENERYANECDLLLYRIIEKARARSASGDAFADRWNTLMWGLIDARPTLRGMMSAEDRTITS